MEVFGVSRSHTGRIERVISALVLLHLDVSYRRIIYNCVNRIKVFVLNVLEMSRIWSVD